MSPLIGACVLVKNEGAGIAEWIAYHLAIGFDTLVIYDNMSTDNTRDVVAKMSRVGDVRCLAWDRPVPCQTDAYDDALERVGAELDWMFFIDADEFVLPLSHDAIHPVMARFPAEVAAVGFNWLHFGSSGLAEQPANTLVMEAFRRHSDLGFPPNAHIKSAVRPQRTLRSVNPHAFEVRGRYVVADGTEARWQQVPGITAEPPVQFGAARVNHYSTKSLAQWQAKVARGRADLVVPRDEDEFAAFDRNEREDDHILRHAPATRDLMAAAGCLAQ
ncbi:MAG TPA: glycosyltransferase family 2 protein [Mycobacteriales bacterium]|nr:glycosyltransferase family 2 protein [Mycobacteriales bacterium]